MISDGPISSAPIASTAITAAGPLNTDPGVFAITGAAAGLVHGYMQDESVGVFALTGADAEFVYGAPTTVTLLTPRDQGKEFSNAGATGPYRYSIPAAVRGMRWGPFVVTAAQPLWIDPNGSDVISTSFTNNDATSPVGKVALADLGAGKYISCATPGARISFRCDITGKLKVTEKIGPWAVEP